MVRNDAQHDHHRHHSHDENGGTTNNHESMITNENDDMILMDDNRHHHHEETDVLLPMGGSSSDPHDGSAKKRGTTTNSSSGGTAGTHKPTVDGITTTIPGRRKGRTSKRNTTSSSTTMNHQNETAQDVFIKYAALFLLVAQMVGLVLLMRYSRTTTKTTDTDEEPVLYLASTAVFIMEMMKLVLCLGVVYIQTNMSISNFISEIHFHVIASPMEMMKLCIPSFLYTVQNNLLYLALTNLDAATYQVCYQLKILTTALFSALLLQRTFSMTKWASLVILTIGVAIVQISGSGDQHSTSTTHSDHHSEELDIADQMNNHNRWIGLLAVICAACTSGFSGVYFEKILKGSRTSLWIRNVQMGIPSVIIAYVTVYWKDAVAVHRQGFFGGYNGIVWTVIIIQAVGGLIVATVVKYADNVLKVFATSFSIIISCIISAFLFDFHPSMSFLVGASLVVTATVMYSAPERKVRRKSILPMTTRTK